MILATNSTGKQGGAMKMAVEIAKVTQFGAGAGVFLVPMFMGKYRHQEQVIVEVFFLACVALALICPVALWLMGERKRAWQGLIVTIVLAVIGSTLSAPMVIQ